MMTLKIMSLLKNASKTTRYLKWYVLVIFHAVLTTNKQKGVTNAQLHGKNHMFDGNLLESARRQGSFPFPIPPSLGKLKNVPEGPIRDGVYNPHYGYEPYWEGGDWVFHRTTQNYRCRTGGCIDMYKNFGPICAQDRQSNVKYFKNYCEMEAESCNTKKEWLIMYRGKCVEQLAHLLRDNERLRSRPPTIMASYANYSQSTQHFNVDRMNYLTTIPWGG